jgi:hypothetical protein
LQQSKVLRAFLCITVNLFAVLKMADEYAKTPHFRKMPIPGRYAKLPIGRSAVIAGISIQHDSIFFASKKISIKNELPVR